MALTGSTIASTYLKLLRANSDTMGADATASYIQDSADTDSVLSISTTRVGIGNAAPDSLLEIEQGASGGLVAFKVDNNDTDKVAVSIEAANIDADVMDISADAVTTVNVIDITADGLTSGKVLNITSTGTLTGSIIDITADSATTGNGINMSMDALTTGSSAIFSTSSTALASTAAGGLVEISSTGDTDTNVNNLLYIKNDHADSTGTTALKIQQDSTGPAIDVGGGYIANEQGRNDHVANTMPAPYYRFDGVDDVITMTNGDDNIIPRGTTPFSLRCVFTPADVTSNSSLVGYGLYGESNMYGLRRLSDGVEIRMFSDGGGFNSTVSSILSEGKTADVIWVRDGNGANTCSVYVNGVLSASISNAVFGATIATATGHNARIGRIMYASPTYCKDQIHKVDWFNKALTATEVKELYSGASVPFKYKGANQTELILAAGASDDNTFASDTTFWTNSGSTTINNSSDGQCVMGASGQYISRTSLLTIGKRYRVNVNVVSGDIRVRQGASYPVGNVGTGVNNMYFTATSTEFEIVANGAAATIDDIYIYQIGAVAEYDGSGIGKTRWDDKSGNDLHGTVSGATVENAPADADSGLTYEEGTWTVTVTGDSGNFVLSGTEETGAYTKIGDLVHAQGGIQIDSESSCSGNIKFSLPFTSGNFTDLSERSFGSVWLVNTGETNSGHMVAVVTSAQAFFNIGQVADNGTNTYLTNAHVDGAWFLGFQITYKV